jgi:hypothetical protein
LDFESAVPTAASKPTLFGISMLSCLAFFDVAMIASIEPFI